MAETTSATFGIEDLTLRVYGKTVRATWRDHLQSWLVASDERPDRHLGYLAKEGTGEWNWHTRSKAGKRVSGRRSRGGSYFPSPYAALVAMCDSRTVGTVIAFDRGSMSTSGEGR